MGSRNKWKLLRNVLWATVVGLTIIVVIGGYFAYKEFLFPNTKVPVITKPYVFIPSGSDFDDVVSILQEQYVLIHPKTFIWTAKKMKYDQHIKSGRYKIREGMSNKDLITMLKSGRQDPVQLIFNNIRIKDELAEKISRQIEAKSNSILILMNDADYVATLGYTPENVLCMFHPNTYEFWWNTSADQFLQRMKKEDAKFWNESRVAKATSIGLSPVEATILASIVEKETNREDEKNIIAGVYMNRLHKGMRLEADPTLVYALGDFKINRVLSIYKQVDSPYNTYKHAGLPPGPICIPSRSSIDAVLNYTHHRYLYFCARDDFSGYHVYAERYEQHQVNARKFQKELNRRGIKQ